MYYNPHTHLALSRTREADLVRRAEQHRLARLVPKEERTSVLDRVLAALRRRHAAGEAAPSAC